MKRTYLYLLNIILLLLCMMREEAIAQVSGPKLNVTVQILPPYSPYLSDYTNQENKILLTITNMTNQSLDVKLLAKFSGNNGIQVSTKPSYQPIAPIVFFPNQTRQFTGNILKDYLSENNIDLVGITKQQVIQQQGIPEGIYQLCVRAFNFNTPGTIEPYSNPEPLGCSSPFQVSYIDPPVLISPLCNSTLTPINPQNVIFTWTPSPGAPAGVMYKLKIVELIPKERDPNDAMNSATTPSFFEQEYQTISALYGSAYPPLGTGKKYAVRISVRDPLNRVLFKNAGNGEVCTFLYGTDSIGVIPSGGAPPPTSGGALADCSCKINLPSGNADNASVSVGSTVKVGLFDMYINQVSTAGGKLQGTGKINLPVFNNKLIPILVDFNDLIVNSEKKAIEGNVKSKMKSDVNFIPTSQAPNLNSIPFSSADAQNLKNYFASNSQQLVSQISGGINTVGFEMPLGVDKSLGGIQTTIAILSFELNPTQAWISAATSITIADAGIHAAFGAKKVCVNTNDICGQGTLFLASDLILPGINMRLKGAANSFSAPSDSGSYVVFDKDGMKNFRIQAEYDFPVGTLVKKSDKVGAIKANLSANALNWSNWTASVTMEPFIISGLDDFSFSLELPGTYDHSTLVNPPNMPYIPEKPNTATPDWFGFHLGKLKMELPEVIKSKTSSGPVSISVKDLIIDDMGVSGDLNALNIFSISQGDLDSWYYSLDTVKIKIINNAFVQGGIGGKIQLPASGKDVSNPVNHLVYSSTLSKISGSTGLTYNFSVYPKNDVVIPMWKATFNLLNSSNINVSTASSGLQAEANLNGFISLATDIGPIPKVDFKAISFEGLVFSTKAPHIKIDNFHAGFASPQKFLAGFPVSLTNIGPTASGNSAGIKFDMNVKLADIATIPNATFGFTVLAKIAMSNGRPDWAFDKVEMNKVAVNGPLGPLMVNGLLDLKKGVPVFGDAIEGSLKVSMLGFFDISSQILFGNTTGSNAYPYWYVYAKAAFMPGIVMAPPLPISLFGFGGGAYYNLKPNGVLPDAKNVYSGAASPPVSALYTPSKGLVGFKATIIMGVADGFSFQAEGTLEATLNSSTLAPSNLKIDTKAVMLSPLMATDNAVVKGSGVINMDFSQKKFDAAFGMHLTMPKVLAGSGTFYLMIDQKNGKWFMKLGDPYAEKVNIDLLSLIVAKGYLMLGNAIPQGMPPPHSSVVSAFPNYKGSRSPGIIEMGSGLAFGASVEYGPKDLTFLIFYMNLAAGMGFDVSLMKLNESCGPNLPSPGVNGWYANGQIWAYADFDFGLEVDVWFYEGRVSAASLKAAALFQTGTPNPTWFRGYLYGSYSVLSGLIKGKMTFQVKVAPDGICEPPPGNPFAGIPLITQLAPEGNNTSILAQPVATFTFPINENIDIEQYDPQKKKMIVRKFMQEITEFDIFKGNTKVFGKTFNGSLGLSADNQLATYFNDFSFDPQTQYKFRVKVKVSEYLNGKWELCIYKGKPVEDSKEVLFKTGDCIVDLHAAGAVEYSYPFDRQRNLTQKDFSKGFLKTRTSIVCLLNNPKYEIKAIFTSMTPVRLIQETDVSVNGKFINFNIPDLPKNTITELKIIQRLVSYFEPGSTSSSSGGVYSASSTYQIHNNYSQISDLTLNLKMIGSYKKNAFDITIYKYYFKTSNFNTIQEKLSLSAYNATAAGSNLMRYADYSSNEGLDFYEIIGFSIPSVAGKDYILPLINIKENKQNNAWYNGFVKPYYNQLGNAYGVIPYKSDYEITRSGWLPPSGPVLLEGQPSAGKLSDIEVVAGLLFSKEP